MNKLLFLLAFALSLLSARSSLAMDLVVKNSGLDVAYATEVIELCRKDLLAMEAKLSLSDKHSLAIYLQKLHQLEKIKEPELMQKEILKIANLAAKFKFSKYGKIDPDFFLIIVLIQNTMQSCLHGPSAQEKNIPEESKAASLEEADLCELLHFLERKRRKTVFNKADFMKSCRYGSLSSYLQQIDFDGLISQLENLSLEEKELGQNS